MATIVFNLGFAIVAHLAVAVTVAVAVAGGSVESPLDLVTESHF